MTSTDMLYAGFIFYRDMYVFYVGHNVCEFEDDVYGKNLNLFLSLE